MIVALLACVHPAPSEVWRFTRTAPWPEPTYSWDSNFVGAEAGVGDEYPADADEVVTQSLAAQVFEEDGRLSVTWAGWTFSPGTKVPVLTGNVADGILVLEASRIETSVGSEEVLDYSYSSSGTVTITEAIEAPAGEGGFSGSWATGFISEFASRESDLWGEEATAEVGATGRSSADGIENSSDVAECTEAACTYSRTLSMVVHADVHIEILQ